jgi:hypothetical protein
MAGWRGIEKGKEGKGMETPKHRNTEAPKEIPSGQSAPMLGNHEWAAMDANAEDYDYE